MCLAAEYSLSFLRVAGLRSPHEWLCLRPHITDSEISASVEKFIERVQQTGELAEWLAEGKKKKEDPKEGEFSSDWCSETHYNPRQNFFVFDGSWRFMLFEGNPEDGNRACASFEILQDANHLERVKREYGLGRGMDTALLRVGDVIIVQLQGL